MPGNIYVLGGTKLFAAIGVTYPAGSTVTCTNGSTTLKAKTTAGEWVFAIPKAGTWTATATNGTSTKSQSVSITKEGQFESVALSYQFVFFENGVLASGYTLGVGSVSSGKLKAFGSASAYSGIAVKEAIDVTKYKTMTVKFGTVSDGYYLGVGLRNSYSEGYEGYGTGWASNFAAYANVGAVESSPWSGTTKTIDISSVTGGKYFKVSTHQTTTCEVESIIFA